MAVLAPTDLDQRPEMASAVCPLFAGPHPGNHHLACGIPEAMGLVPTVETLRGCLGVLVLLDRIRPAGALGICAYSEAQVTWWGPAVAPGYDPRTVARALGDQARAALRDGGYESIRVLVDTRNREQRALVQGLGFTAWKDALLYEVELPVPSPESVLTGIRIAARADHAQVTRILSEGFPDSGHLDANLVQRENEGYRHYLLEEGGEVLGAAAVKPGPARNWLKLIAVRGDRRGRDLGHRLLAGIIASEGALRGRALGLEVLADNQAAIRIYEKAGFQRRWSATVMTGPV